jgi:hypothetical protein
MIEDPDTTEPIEDQDTTRTEPSWLKQHMNRAYRAMTVSFKNQLIDKVNKFKSGTLSKNKIENYKDDIRSLYYQYSLYLSAIENDDRYEESPQDYLLPPDISKHIDEIVYPPEVANPTVLPTTIPTENPTNEPSHNPSNEPTIASSALPTYDLLENIYTTTNSSPTRVPEVGVSTPINPSLRNRRKREVVSNKHASALNQTHQQNINHYVTTGERNGGKSKRKGKKSRPRKSTKKQNKRRKSRRNRK